MKDDLQSWTENKKHFPFCTKNRFKL